MNPDEVARTSVDVTRRSVETQRKSSDIPRLYAEARQSIDIVQRSKVTADIKKRPTKKVVSKAKKKAISIEEHKLTVPQVVSLYKSGFDPEFPDKIKVGISLMIGTYSPAYCCCIHCRAWRRMMQKRD